jgi:hypothetical protein
VPSDQDDRIATASRFVATLGATMAAANYPVTMVREVMAQTSLAHGLDHQTAVQLSGSPHRRALHD